MSAESSKAWAEAWSWTVFALCLTACLYIGCPQLVACSHKERASSLCREAIKEGNDRAAEILCRAYVEPYPAEAPEGGR